MWYVPHGVAAHGSVCWLPSCIQRRATRGVCDVVAQVLAKLRIFARHVEANLRAAVAEAKKVRCMPCGTAAAFTYPQRWTHALCSSMANWRCGGIAVLPASVPVLVRGGCGSADGAQG